jgi:CHAT domain-containing protein
VDGAIRAMGNVEDLVHHFVTRGGESAGTALCRMAEILRDGGRPAEAIEILERHGDVCATPFARLAWTSTTAGTLMRLGRWDEAVPMLRQARRHAKDSGIDPLEIDLNRVSVMVTLGRHRPALRLVEHFASDIGGRSLDLQVNVARLRARALAGLDRIKEARQAADEAIELRERMRADLRTFTTRIAFQGGSEDDYEFGVVLALRDGDMPGAFELVERARSRAFLDEVAAGGLLAPDEAPELALRRSFLAAQRGFLQALLASLERHGPGFVDHELMARFEQANPSANLWNGPSADRRTLSLPRLHEQIAKIDRELDGVDEELENAALTATPAGAVPTLSAAAVGGLLDQAGPGIVLAEYVVIRGRIVLFLSRAGQTEPVVRMLDVTADDLRDLTRRATRAGTGGDAVLRVAGWESVAAGLAEPILDVAAEGDLIWLVPHDDIHFLPLHAAPVGGRHLIDRNPVCSSPSASIMGLCRSRATGRLASALVMGDPLGDLPYAEEEAITVAGLFGTVPLLGAAATAAALRGRAGDFDVLHLCCHATIDRDDPLQSGVVLAAGAGVGGETLTVRDLLGLDLGAEIAILSACDTGLSERRSGDELVGLVRAILRGGAASVLVSLWAVDDHSTALLVGRFYQRLLADKPGRQTRFAKAEALRTAQRELRAMTAGEVLQECEKRLAGLAGSTNARRVRRLEYAYANALVGAGELAAAAAALEALDHVLADASDPLLRTRVQRARTLVRVKSEAGVAADHERRPFADPRHWAPFILVGDWG